MVLRERPERYTDVVLRLPATTVLVGSWWLWMVSLDVLLLYEIYLPDTVGEKNGVKGLAVSDK